MKGDMKAEEEKESKERTIQSEPSFCMRILPARKANPSTKKQQQEKIHLFDFN